MKQNTLLTALLFSVTTTVAPASAAEIPWHTFTGGGGIAQHGSVALGGAIGPIAPSLSPAIGGKYTLAGGFWPPLTHHPQSASPVLRITALGKTGEVRLSWPMAVTGFALEFTTQLGSGAWQPEPGAVVDTATEHTVTVPAQSAFRCFRLRSF